METNKKKNKPVQKEMYAPKNDPQGSYTGNSVDGKQPQQDADDL